MVTQVILYDQSWYPDTGTLAHTIDDLENLINKTDYNLGDPIHLGNGNALTVKHIGNSTIQFPFDSNTSFKLNNILHVPQIQKNLINVSKFVKDNPYLL